MTAAAERATNPAKRTASRAVCFPCRWITVSRCWTKTWSWNVTASLMYPATCITGRQTRGGRARSRAEAARKHGRWRVYGWKLEVMRMNGWRSRRGRRSTEGAPGRGRLTCKPVTCPSVNCCSGKWSHGAGRGGWAGLGTCASSLLLFGCCCWMPALLLFVPFHNCRSVSALLLFVLCNCVPDNSVKLLWFR